MAMATPTAQGTPSKLDSASREDLLKLLKRQLLTSKKNAAEHEKEKESLNETVSSLKEERDSLQSTVEQIQRENEDWHSSNQKILAKLEDMSGTVKQLMNEREDHLSELAVLRDNKDQMKTVVGMLQESEGELKDELSQLKRRLEEEKEKQSHEEKQREEQATLWKDQIESLTLDLAESKKKLAAAEKNATLQAEIFSAKADIAALRGEGDSLKNMISEYNSQFAAETETISRVLGALDSVQKNQEQNQAEQNQADQLQAERLQVEQLQAELREQQDLVACLEAKDMQYKEKVERLTTEMEELQRLREEPIVKDDKRQVRDEENEADGDTPLTITIEKLETELKESQIEKKELEEKLVALEEEKRKISLHLDEFISESATFKDQEETEEELRAQYFMLKHEVLEKEQQITELEKRLDTVTRHLEEASNTNEEEQLKKAEEKQLLLEQFEEEKAKLQEEIKTTASKLQEENEATESIKEELTKAEDLLLRKEEDFVAMVTERDSLSSQVFLLEEQISQLKSEVESEQTRIETLEHSSREAAKLVSSKEEEISRLNTELEEAIDTNKKLKEDTRGSHHLMDMELADYQRAAGALQEKLNLSKMEIKNLENEIQKKETQLSKVNAEMKEIDKLRVSSDEMITKLKVLLMKSKKEAADSKKAEEESKQICDDTKRSLEQSLQECEEFKLVLSEVQGQLSNSTDVSRRSLEEKAAMIKLLEGRVSTLMSDVEKERESRTEVSAQFESYKVRVHSVLKQQRSNDAVIGINEHEAIVVQLSKEAELLKCQVHELRETRDLVTSERDALDSELGSLATNLDRLERDSSEREKFYLERVGELEEAVRNKEAQIYKGIQSAAAQRTALTESYTKTIEQASASHQEAQQLLQDRIERLESEVRNGKTPAKAEPIEHMTTRIPPHARIAAEGMESPLPPATVGLEDILNSSTFSRSTSRALSFSSESTKEGTKEDSNLVHLRALLSESEHNAAALQEQCSVLKGEVRRMETMLGNGNTNIEYLKNVVLKYLSAEATEREQLVTVLATVLQLTREERSTLTDRAKEGKREAVPWSSSWFSSS